VLDLQVKVSFSNVHAFDPDYREIVRFSSAVEVLDMYMPRRLALYEQRRQAMIGAFEAKIKYGRAKARYIEMRLADDIPIRGTLAYKLELLQKLEFPRDDSANGYDYLLSKVTELHFTTERIQAMREEAARNEEYLAFLRGTSPREMWRKELTELRRGALDKFEAERAELMCTVKESGKRKKR
jgi:DNA gyrase/topoisomerase IV, subunit A.